MSVGKVLFATAIAVAFTTAANAATIVNYDLTGLPGSGTTPPASANATTVAPGLTSADPVTRGAGVNGEFLANGFSADNWTLSSSDSIAVTNGDYFQFGFDVDGTHKVSISTFETNLRRSAAASPPNYRLYVSFDDFATAGTLVDSFSYLGRNSGTAGTPALYSWMTTDTPGQANGNPIQPQDLSGVAILQNIAPGSSVMFRLYAWGAVAGAADSNTVALGRVNGPKLSGDITDLAVPEPTTLGLLFTCVVAGCLVRRKS